MAITSVIGRPSNINNNSEDVKFTKLAKKRRLETYDSALLKKTKKIMEEEGNKREWKKFEPYKNNIEEYAKDHFGIILTPQQKEVIDALLTHRFVCVRASHSLGKSYLLGILINYFFDVYYPLIGIGTAPTKKLVEKVMFGYARQFRDQELTGNLVDYWRGSTAARIESDEGHYFEGMVTKDPTSAHGRHGENVVLVIDEAVGIDQEMFEALESLMIADNVFVLCIYNPTDPSAYVRQLEQQSQWHVITMSAYDHPNIWKGVENLQQGKLTTDDLPFPGAINLSWFEQKLKQWSTKISQREYDPIRDIILPSSIIGTEIEYYRPGPIACSRLLGRWPEISLHNIFSDYDISKAKQIILAPNPSDVITIGVDVARYGTDFSSFCVRHGGIILRLFEVNGLKTTEVTDRVIELAKEFSEIYEIPAQTIDIAVDGIGIGAGVCDNLIDKGYNVHEINVSERSWLVDEYVNLRSELWFKLHDEFVDGNISLVNIDEHTIGDLTKQLLAPQYSYDIKQRRKVESKDQTKSRIDRSPDLADAIMLAYSVNSSFSNTITVDTSIES